MSAMVYPWPHLIRMAAVGGPSRVMEGSRSL
jgi:hypothetical protein